MPAVGGSCVAYHQTVAVLKQSKYFGWIMDPGIKLQKSEVRSAQGCMAMNTPKCSLMGSYNKYPKIEKHTHTKL